jgi:ABC-type branched-subunit amino acid transport system substrate-binding protein
MAQYAIKNRGFKRLAVLAPSDSYGRFLAQAFVEEVKRLGGRVIATEWYERKTSDLQKQLRAIRQAGLHAGADPLISFGGKKRLGELMKLAGLGVPVKTLDSLMHRGATVSVAALVGPDAVPKLDSLGISVVYNDIYLDSLDVPVTSIDGLYLPIGTPEEIGVVTSQVVYFNLHAQLLGTGEWNSLEELDANRRYCSGLIFESDSYADSAVAGYGEWCAAYSAAMKRAPTKHTLYGYDAAGLVLSLLRAGSTTRAGLRRSLAEVHEFQGFHARIGFSPGRVNAWLPILQFDGRNVMRVDEIKTE